jgi:hypothetical protein
MPTDVYAIMLTGISRHVAPERHSKSGGANELRRLALSVNLVSERGGLDFEKYTDRHTVC